MPTTGLATLVQPLPLPRRDDPVEERLLGARIVEVVIDDVVAERNSGHPAMIESRYGLAQRRREAIRR